MLHYSSLTLVGATFFQKCDLCGPFGLFYIPIHFSFMEKWDWVLMGKVQIYVAQSCQKQ